MKKSVEDTAAKWGFCNMYPAPGLIERVGPDWDWVWIDGQHGQFGYPDILAAVRACDLIQRPAFVRVAGHEPGPIGMALDTGARGIIVPQVDTPEQAQRLVHAAKFPPLGNRSYGSRRNIDREGRLYSTNANERTLLVCQIESPEGVDNAEAIAAVPGVDILFPGPDDIMLRRGFSMEEPRNKETLGADLERVAAACRQQGKQAMSVGFGKVMADLCASLGYAWIVGSGDVALLANGSKAASEECRSLGSVVPPVIAGTAQRSGGIYG